LVDLFEIRNILQAFRRKRLDLAAAIAQRRAIAMSLA
jgi:hypothetical protein